MRCICCNTRLTEYEATLRGSNTGDYLDMCASCLGHEEDFSYVEGSCYVEDLLDDPDGPYEDEEHLDSE